jgi:hypothetical protein
MGARRLSALNQDLDCVTHGPSRYPRGGLSCQSSGEGGRSLGRGAPLRNLTICGSRWTKKLLRPMSSVAVACMSSELSSTSKTLKSPLCALCVPISDGHKGAWVSQPEKHDKSVAQVILASGNVSAAAFSGASLIPQAEPLTNFSPFCGCCISPVTLISEVRVHVAPTGFEPVLPP